MNTQRAEYILKRFKGRDGIVAIQPVGSNFRPVEKAVTADDIVEDHLAGKKCYGFYLMEQDNTVMCTCVDFDNHKDRPDVAWKDKAETTYFFVQELGLDPVMEISSSGTGAHVWIFFTEPVPAYLARRFWQGVDNQLSIGFDEIYPRQDKLKNKGYGNLIRYPWWNESRFVEPSYEWATVDFPNFELCSIEDLEGVCIELSQSVVPPDPPSELSEQVQELLASPNSQFAARWEGHLPDHLSDHSRSAIVFQIACELVYQRVPTDEIIKAIEVWCDKEGYYKGIGWIEATVDNAYASVRKRTTAVEKKETLLDCVNVYFNRSKNQRHMPSGIYPIDQSIDGVGAGEVCIIMARPSHGKTALALQWQCHLAKKGIPSLSLNAEMSPYELGRRIIMNYVGDDEKQWQEDPEKLRNEIAERHSHVSKIYYEGVGTIDEVEAAIKRYVQAHRIQFVVIDYVQLLRSTTIAGRYEVVTEISQRIKSAAREHQVGIIALCQCSREVERRDEVEFLSSDLRDSGSLEQDADLIMGGWFHGRSPRGGGEDQYDVHIIKRRNGPIRNNLVRLKFDSSRQNFGWENG